MSSTCPVSIDQSSKKATLLKGWPLEKPQRFATLLQMARTSLLTNTNDLVPCEVCGGCRFWFSGLQWNCCRCNPQPLGCMIRFELNPPDKMSPECNDFAERPLDLDQLARLRKMDAEALKRHGEGAAFLCMHSRGGPRLTAGRNVCPEINRGPRGVGTPASVLEPTSGLGFCHKLRYTLRRHILF